MFHRYFKHRWFQLSVAAYILGTAALGFVELRRQYPGLPTLDYVLRTFLLFSLYGVGEPDGSAKSLHRGLLVARGLAAIFTIAAGTALLRRVLGEEWVSIRLWIRPPDVIVCGLGEKGRHLAASLRKGGQRVAAIERADHPDDIGVARESGVTVLRGNAAERYILRRANLKNASALVVLTGSDRTNVEVALLAAATVENTRRDVPLRCAVHLVSSHTRELLQQSGLFPSGGACAVSFFNVDEMTARLFLTTHLPTTRADGLHPHLVVIGFGQLGESLALQYAHLSHHPLGNKPRVTAVTPDASKAERRLLTRFPRFREACEIDFVPCDLIPGAIQALPDFSGDSAHEPRQIVVAGENDVSNLLVALELRRALPALKTPIYLRMRDGGSLGDLRGSSVTGEPLPSLVPFGRLEAVCAPENVLDEWIDPLAQAIHERYCEQAVNRHETAATNSALLPWKQLGEDLREACRRQADHHLVKLRAVGARSVPLAPGEKSGAFAFTPEELEALSRAEHRRWCAERHLSGWTHAPERDNLRKRHPLLVPWEILDEDSRDKDRDVIRSLPDLFAQLGQKIERVQATTATPLPSTAGPDDRPRSR